MDRPLGPTKPLNAALSAAMSATEHLLSRSELVEPGTAPHCLSETVAALNWLSQLEHLAQSTIAPKTSEPGPLCEMPATPPTNTRSVTTSRPEYKPALRDRELVEALLRLERSNGLRPAPAKQETQDEGFAPAQMEAVRTVPKPSPFRRTTGTTLPVLRPADENS